MSHITDERKKMVRSLKKIVVPVLRSQGFSGSFPHFRRLQDNQINLVTFQFNRYGGSFVVEIGQCAPHGVRYGVANGKEVVIPPEKVTTGGVMVRKRLGRGKGGNDHWFEYGKDVSGGGTTQAISFLGEYDVLSKIICTMIQSEAEQWFKATKFRDI